jgi:hypothetical protein
MKKIMLTLVVLFAIVSLNAQTYLKYEFMKELPGQDYEKLEKSWVNYHKELIKAGVINMHRIWKVLPGANVNYDYIVSTAYNNYADALGIGKSIALDDFKTKYPEDYIVMVNNTTKSRTMVKQVILKVELGLNDNESKVVPGSTILNLIFINSKNDNYEKAEIKFSNKWHQNMIDKNRKDEFYLTSVVGIGGVDFTNTISHIYKNIDQYTTGANTNDVKFTTQEQAEYETLRSYRDLKKSMMLINVMNIEK